FRTATDPPDNTAPRYGPVHQQIYLSHSRAHILPPHLPPCGVRLLLPHSHDCTAPHLKSDSREAEYRGSHLHPRKYPPESYRQYELRVRLPPQASAVPPPSSP